MNKIQTTPANRLLGTIAGAVLFVSCGAPAEPDAAGYHAADDPTLRLELQSDEDAQVRGMLHWQGTAYAIEGEWADEDEIAGYAEHDTESLLFDIEIDDDDGRLYLTLMPMDGRDDMVAVELVASPGAAALAPPSEPARGAQADAAPPESPAAPPAASAGTQHPRDPRLVGIWAKQDIMSDSSMTVATQSFMRLDANGVLSSGPARTMGGGAGWHGDTGLGGETFSVYWRTEGQILQISTGPDGPWQPFARFHIEGVKLLLQYYDGSRDLWYRQ